MKILFVSSGNRKNGLNPIIRLQAESLSKEGLQISHFLIFGKGFIGYLKNINKLKKYLRDNPTEVIHAHFGFSCIVAQLAKGKIPLLVTLMGTDVMGHKVEEGKASLSQIITNLLNKFFANYIYKAVIVKSLGMKNALSRSSGIHVIPNGVNLQLFRPISKKESLEFLNWTEGVNHFIFLANPERAEKNFKLATDAIDLLKSKGYAVELLTVFQEQSENLKYYYGAATALLLTSFHEGSPNVVKEAFACNCPVVSTNVGDVADNFKGLDGCFIAPFDVEGFADKIIEVIKFAESHGRIKGQQQIEKLGLDEKLIAQKIINLYSNLINKS